MGCLNILLILFSINYAKSQSRLVSEYCLDYITDYNICMQTAKRNWPTITDSFNYCCFLIDLQECRKLLRFKKCEVDSMRNIITQVIHDEIRQNLSKILFIGDVCSKYKDTRNCFNNLWALSFFLFFIFFFTAIISITIKKQKFLKSQITNQKQIKSLNVPKNENNDQFLKNAKRVRFI